MALDKQKMNTGYNHYIQLEITQGEQEIGNNRTWVYWSLKTINDNGSGYWQSYGVTANVVVNGSTVYTLGSTYKYYGVGTHTIASGGLWVSHGSDGIKNVYSSASFRTNFGTHSLSASMGLTNIPRMSVMTLSHSSQDVGSSVTVYTNRASSDFTHILYAKWSGGGNIQIASGIGASFVWSIPTSFLPLHVAQKTLTLTLDTYSNGVRVGATYKDIIITMPFSNFVSYLEVYMGEPFYVTISPVATQLTHWIQVMDGSTVLYSSGNVVKESQRIHFSIESLAVRSPNSTEKNFTIRVDTFNGNQIIGGKTWTIRAILPVSVCPSIGAVTVSEYEGWMATYIGAFVQLKSRLNLAIVNAKGIYGSTITNFKITGVNYTTNSSSGTTPSLNVSGIQTITGEVIDSRGRSAQKKIVINILPYSSPQLSDISVKRCLPDGTENPLGDHVKVKAKVTAHSLIVNGVQKNSSQYQVKSAQKGYSFATKKEVYSNNLTEIYEDVWVGYPVDYSYDFQIRGGDFINYTSINLGTIPTGVVTQHWSSKTTSFGKLIDNTGYNVQVGEDGLHSEGNIFSEKNMFMKTSFNVWQSVAKYNHYDFSGSGSWESLFSANYHRFPNGEFVSGIINKSGMWTYTGMRTNPAYGAFLVTGYDGVYYVWVYNGNWHATGLASGG